MRGNPLYRPAAGRGRGQQPPPYPPPSQPPPPPGVNMNSNFAFQDPNLIVQSLLVNNLLQNLASQQQQHGFNFPVQQNPNFQFQSLNFAPTQPPPQQSGTTGARQQQLPSPSVGKQEKKVNKKEMMERVDRAVEKAWRASIEAGESVSVWKVSQAVLESLEVDSWGSLGFKMQEVPSLHRIILTEGKINAFVNCFVGVRRITTLYDLEVAICKNEGVEKFEELELGPLVKHPLVLHYFSVNSDINKVFKITSEEVVMWLSEFMDASKKKEISADEFLEFIASKHSVKQKELLGVRIQSLGMHISFIQEAKGYEKETVKSCRTILETKSNNSGKKRLLSASQKKVLDERFSSISQRVESFSLAHKDFCGKHTRFVSSSSEDEKSDNNLLSYEDTVISNKGRNVMSPLQNVYGAERASGCPYPSASEERSRLGLKNETSGQKPSASGGSMKERSNRLFKRKRKLESNLFTPSKLLKSETETQKSHVTASSNESEKIDTFSEEDISLSNNSIKVFVTTWKEACREKTVRKVLEKMIRFYHPKGSMSSSSRKQIRSTFSMHPCIELLNVAVTSIKCGMWDSMYDAFQAINQNEQTNINSSECERIDVEPAEKPITVISEQRVQQTSSVTVEDIIGRVTSYYELDPEIQKSSKTLFTSLRELCNCESWLVDQFGVKEFKSLGHGDFLSFIEKHGKLLPSALQNLWAGKISEKSSLEVCISQHQLIALVSQASNSLWDNETITKQMISALLIRQFPLIGFKVMEKGSLEDFLEIVEKHRNEVISKCVIFSASLQGDSFPSGDDSELEITSVRNNSDLKISTCGPVSYKDAVEVLTAAPMLSDLNSWSHWDQIFAPSLGPLVGWLLTEVNSKELFCLVTKNGKVIKIDPSATADLFLSGALQRSAFQTAVNLLSLFSLTGGEKHVPASLLKCYARRAFDVLLSDHDGNGEVEGRKDSPEHEKIVDLDCKVKKDSTRINGAVRAASRFVIDSLGYLPSEFRGFAADILLHGMQSVMRAAPSCILCMCTQKERIMFHEIGLSIGILEWVDDYHAFRSNQATQSISSGQSSFEVAQSSLHVGSTRIHNTVDVFSYAGGRTIASLREDALDEKFSESGQTVDDAALSNHGIGHKRGQSPDDSNCEDAIRLIESIRRDEFGLDPSLSVSESCMLKKQHARLGRALHCLSQELYSQDSHFILELVQNADDNIYPENEEPTLTFILQELGIIILNNEQGFSAQNIRALCDVGNSTKKGSDAGYIGQKGIGFKSVFRVTDAPEIHSKGFHIKFDISEGQIGFVLPTIVPPCNVNFFSRLLSGDDKQINKRCWNTCIVLPFRSKFSGETVINMFSDLHPSLLLFLHRLECIMFRNMLNDSLIIMKKETLTDGIVNVSCGKDKMTWLVASQKLQGHASRPKVQTTEIAIAFTLEESDNGVYSPRLEQQPVFSFLPLRTYGLKFILQGDFVLPSSREEVDKNNPWNEWLLMNFPALFVSAEKDFCALSCFRENPGKAVSAFMSFVPLVGEVHGFFSRLPKAIILELRRTECLLLEGDNFKMVPPCNVLRGWNERALHLLPDDLLQRHLGLGFLDKNIVISDPLARALGIVEYGPEILVRFMTCLCNTENGLKLMGLCWLSSWLDALYVMLSYSSESANLIDRLQNIPFIPLSDGTYSSVDVDAVWLHSDGISTNLSSILGLEAFPNLYAKLRTVNPFLLSASSDRTVVDNVTGMLHRIGVQELSAHEIIKVHILPAICDGRSIHMDTNLLTDYLCFVMIHLQSSCHSCYMERPHIISELHNKAYILTNHGCKKLTETPIHFSREFGNPIDVNKLVDVLDMRWHEVDINYLKHPANEALSNGLGKWRGFFREIGVRDFVQVGQTEKTYSDLSQTVLKNITWDRDLISSGSLAKDWESPELMNLLSLLSRSGDRECCKYLLEILDTLWNDEFSDKVTGCFSVNGNGDGRLFTSSFVYIICDVQWVVSSIDNKLHFPKELFYDCDAVRSILGASAPYALPKMKSEMLVRHIGFKTRVALNDALEILTIWREGGTAFEASIAQMTKFYTLMWDEMAASRNKILEAIRAGPFIFVPSRTGSRHEDLVPGFFFSLDEVYWHDPTGSVDQLRRIHTKCTVKANERPMSKTLCNIYPGLHDFFKECGVRDFPSSYAYLDILQQLSTVTSPSRSASLVFQVFLRWADELKSGLLRSDDIIHLKDCLLKLEYAVLPTVQDKWVSLHPSFGLVCWCDDEKLADRCKNTSNIDFLYFGDLDDHEKEVLQTKMSVLMQNLGIPAFSEVITRKAIYYGLSGRSSKFSLINWVLPFAQRYIHSTHPEKYYQLKQSGFNSLKQLNLVVVEKLFYVNVIKGVEVASEKRYECSALLQDNTLYATVESDPHALFLELSRLFFDGASDLHMANFLHLITTMAESGSTEEQAEFFIVNSQNVQKLPDEESVWSLPSVAILANGDKSLQSSVASLETSEEKVRKSKKKAGVSSNWPPADWKTAPDFNYARAHGFNTQADSRSDKLGESSVDIMTESKSMLPVEISTDWTIEENNAETVILDSESGEMGDRVLSLGQNLDVAIKPDELHFVSDGPEVNSSRFSRREQLNTGTVNTAQALLTGRLGEHVAYKYLTDKFGTDIVRWVNEDSESGLPYDIVVGEEEGIREYIEVKATRSARKDWFNISMREWRFAVEKGDSFSISHVMLFGNNSAKVTTFKNPVKQCQQGKLQLVVMMPRQQESSAIPKE